VERPKFDSTQVDEARAEALRQAELAKLARRSLAVQKDLPRPRVPPALPSGGDDPESLINAEAIRLVRRDASLHPLKGGTMTSDAPLPEFTDDELAKARSLIEEEASRAEPYDDAAFAQAWSESVRKSNSESGAPAPPRHRASVASMARRSTKAP